MSAINFTDVVFQTPRRVCHSIWDGLPGAITQTRAMRRLGRYIYRRFTRHTVRTQSHYTQFMRNPPLLDVLARLLSEYQIGSTVKLASIGCSTGAELYSALYVLRRARPDLKILATGVDISSEVIKAAERGIYCPGQSAATNGLYLEGRPELFWEDAKALRDLFEVQHGGTLRVQDRLRKDTNWLTADATEGGLADTLGPQNIVLANNVMGPMDDSLAEVCLRNVMNLVEPGGYLVVDGIDLDLKTRVLATSDFKPVLLGQEELWSADGSKDGWPWVRWGREPLDRTEPTWELRYSIIFQHARV
ncbi:chemotaxis methyl-accepting protein methylase [Ensifer adhaerens]|uniref:Chemotaxis methyl-accepting protein methylase n=1 Tax=Ensifer adhaerens TaxID=106592 RepID=A0ACC5ST17_ENSAD|nr:CheR family methyltransferase [Ensifer adhaerens]MBP1871899.1 chemotaxis methyl-accepting protein methylase [Ensifer adhaerens]